MISVQFVYIIQDLHGTACGLTDAFTPETNIKKELNDDKKGQVFGHNISI